ncbi:hypothetical protein D1007_10498 [Hordeum vulgare]|uniref:Uncharacterized protein n=1 Tax=Hordeum vulgare subsp. vulgare TaxID=112509 RepID=A0A8I6WSB6_HORVV|nr:uncharacterized protein LOC123444991 [Hordeum vulgare subsp. vulgare]KAE8812570.1 hypothetical protein D1007_10498 [Hordeum vulgare]KAI5019045.1 hypothetical protein ZWY2020_043933 [Hordeum vulgare]
MESDKPASLLGTLRTAVKKVRFLLSFSATRWIISSIAGRRTAPSATAPLRLSFGSRRPGLLDAEDDRSPASSSTSGPTRTASLGSGGVSRTSSAVAASDYSRSASSGATSSSSSSGGSSPAGDEDIDRRAELFIANFYKHIQMERQVSLQLRYCRDDSLQERSPTRRVT